MNKHDLNSIGIELAVNLNDTVTILRSEFSLPVVFLFDEHHGNLNNCIDKNIENAKELIKTANVKIIGVESHTGGRQFDQYYRIYSDEELRYDPSVNKKNSKSNCPTFANGLIECGISCLYGVECWDMLDSIQCDLLVSDNPYHGKPVTEHHLNICRSKHFIRTLFEHYNSNHLKGNLILNCGRDHNSHIEQWIKSGEIDEITNFKANYVRLNTIDN